MVRLRRIARNVPDLAEAQAFYTNALGFAPLGSIVEDPNLATLLGVSQVRSLRMALGAQHLELTECTPRGAPYPTPAQANDPWFQHIAIVTTDIRTASARAIRAGAVPISSHGPQKLPPQSGAVTAWKFRDPHGHPLEFLQFPNTGIWTGDALFLGYDHSAITVADTAKSIAFYAALGLNLHHRQTNTGPEQDRLDGLESVTVDVVAIGPPDPPRIELLGYHTPHRQKVIPIHPNDIAADRLVFADAPSTRTLIRDPDGHFLLLDEHA